MTKPPPELLEFLYRYDPAIQSLALGLRKVVLEELVPCHEYIFEMRSKVVLVYGLTARVIADGVGVISVFRKHVTLAFSQGAELKDPAGVLQGRGRFMRHLSVKTLGELDRPEIRALLRQARKRAGPRPLARRTPDDVVTRVKPRAAPRWPT